MLIIIPSSESKRRPPDRGRPVALDALSFPELSEMRARILDALIETSAGPDALRRLAVGPAMGEEVARNTQLRDLPARPVLEVYTGVLHDGFDAATLSPEARRRATRRLVIASSLWGLLRPSDRIPSYRLDICARLDGMDRLESAWRTVLPDVLAEAAGPRGVIFDVRSLSYQAIGMPTGLGNRTVTLRVAQDADGGRLASSFIAKRVRGQAARHLLESGADPRSPQALADLLAGRWPVHLDPPERPGGHWIVTVVAAA